MHGRLYTAVFGGIAVSAIQDLFELVAPSDGSVVVHGLWVGQSSDAGDSEAELLRYQITRGHTTSGSGGAAVTPNPLNPSSVAFGGTAERNNTTQATGGSPLVLWEDVFNAQAGLVWLPPPEHRIVLNPSQRLVVELPAAPADALTMSGTLLFEEL